MIVKKNVVTDKDGSYIEAIYDSSNILNSVYFPHLEKLYVSFNRGGTYSYQNISETFYNEFETAESQGKFFKEKIKPFSANFPVTKEFTLLKGEVNEMKEIVNNSKNKI